ncbi:ABC transporter ATP-binding protein [Coprothermobacteraceae bacterium]|nr:ABC transporter ATP-binding protein [Coprothermobacteraceae bacterium]
MFVDPVFRLHALGYHYPDGTPALQGITWQVSRGESWAVLGTNGSGKSTLLKILDALFLPTEGTLEIFGIPLDENTIKTKGLELHRRIGLLFQDPDVQLFSPTIFDDVAFGLRQLKEPAPQVTAKVNAILTEFRIDDVSEKMPFRISGGQKKKAALASVLVLEPEVLLLDEPTNDLDPRTKRWLIAKLTEFRERGGTLVVASHEVDVVFRLCEKALVLSEDHHVLFQGDTSYLQAHPELLEQANLL